MYSHAPKHTQRHVQVHTLVCHKQNALLYSESLCYGKNQHLYSDKLVLLMSPNVRGWQLIFGNGAQHLQRWWRHLKIMALLSHPHLTFSDFVACSLLLFLSLSHWFLFLFVYLSFFHPFFFLTLSSSLIFIFILFSLQALFLSFIHRILSECIQFKICCSFFYTMLFHLELEGTS